MVRYEREITFDPSIDYHYEDDDEENKEFVSGKEKYSDTEEEDDPSTRSLLLCGTKRGGGRSCLGGILDPRAPWVQEWNRVYLLICAAGLLIDPLFFYALSLSSSYLCLYVDGWFAVGVTIVRCLTDVIHLWDMWMQLKMSKHPYSIHGIGGRLETDSRVVALRYMKNVKGFSLDVFAILPIPQIIMWVVTPHMLRNGETTKVMTVHLVTFLVQFIVRIFHTICLVRRMQKASGYVFGTVAWGFFLNLVTVFVASHAVGACWYLLGLQRVLECLTYECNQMSKCSPKIIASRGLPIYFGTKNMLKDRAQLIWGANKKARGNCLDSFDNYEFGAYQWVTYLVAEDSHWEKILLPIFWGIMNLVTFGNIEGTSDWEETVFFTIVVALGLIFLTMMIANIKVAFRNTKRKFQFQRRMRQMEWWMKRRNLPSELKQRVRNYELQRWAATRGINEIEMVKNLPEGIRRDIKYHLCLDLVRQVPLFQHIDNLVLENICDRVKPVIFTRGEIIDREGDPAKQMLFIVRGHLQSIQTLRNGLESRCMLGPGNFTGDELLSWCLRRPFIDRLPSSSSTLVTLETIEAFSLEAEDLKYVTQQFRYTFLSEKVKRCARYYSPGWRTWAAVAIQLAWRSRRRQLKLNSLWFIRPRSPLSRSNSISEDKLRFYAALLAAPKPADDKEDIV